MNELLQQLTEVVGVAGDEKEVRLLLRDLIADHVDEWRVDTMGNLLAVKRGTGDSDLRVLVDAHMDEVGLLITEIDNDGTLKFETVGGLADQALLGKTVQVGAKKYQGVIGARPIHLVKSTQYNNVVSHDSMRIDIGATKKANAANKVKVGDRATFLTNYQESGSMAMGKALDNRAGCAALVELLRRDPYPFDLHAAFTVQEEVGLRGAQVAAYATKPNVALVLECTPAYDLPSKRDISPNVRLGKGPSLYVMDSRTIQDPRFVRHIMRTAENQGIPFQVRQPGGGGTNAGAIQRMHGGVVTATMATPARYIHAPMAMINLEDFNNVVRLADATLRGLHRGLFER